MVVSLEELLSDDITDPSFMDNIQIKLDEILIEDDEFMTVLTKNTDPRIIYWEQPWYQQTGSISRPLKDDSESKDYRVDTISSDEVEQIEKNWRKFIQKYDIPDKIMCLARWRSTVKNCTSKEDKSRTFAVSFLARGLERTLYHIFRFIVRHYAAPVKQKKFTKEEEKFLEVLLQHNPENATVIASKVLNRQPRGISKKLNEISKGKDLLPKLKWHLDLLAKFVKLLMRLSETEHIKDLKYKTFSKDVWLKAEEEMGQHYYFLQRYWYTYLHVQLFVKEPVYLKKVKKRVYKILKKSTYRLWSDIRWKTLLDYFPDGYTHLFLYKVSQSVLTGRKDRLTTPLPELIDYALQQIKQCRINKRMRKLRFNENGEIIIQ